MKGLERLTRSPSGQYVSEHWKESGVYCCTAPNDRTGMTLNKITNHVKGMGGDLFATSLENSYEKSKNKVDS